MQVMNTHHSRLLGHRGARGERRENSWQGFDYLQKLSQLSNNKLVGIEFDVQLTKDNLLAVFHDDDLSRLYHNQQRVDHLTYENIKQITATTYPIPLLDEVLNKRTSLFNQYERIELEIKTHLRTNYSQLIAALAVSLQHNRFKNNVIVLTSFDTQLLEHLQKHPFLSSFPRGLLVESQSFTFSPKQQCSEQSANRFNNIPYTALRLGCSGVGLHYPLYSHNIINLCQRLGLTTTAWTVNSASHILHLTKLGVDYIITDYPAKMLNLSSVFI